jgi:LacI family transcriptional regulator
MATIKDVAKRAGVGVGTVSRVVAGSGPVSEKTAKRVRKAIAELQFRPSHLARSLPTGQSQTIGVYLPVIYGSFFTPMLHTLYTALRDSGRRMMVAFGGKIENERQEILEGAQFLADHGCDGVLMMATALETRDVDYLLQLQPHLVLLNRSLHRFRNRCFCPDHEAAGRLAAATLWDAGHRDFACIEGNSFSNDNIARIKGFFAALEERGVAVGRIPKLNGNFSPAGGKAAAEELVARHERFTALFCANDESATGALSYFHQVGISVPGDISVIGYDGLDLASFTAPPLTTIRLPWPDICVNALNWLLNDCYELGLPVKRNFSAEVLWHGSVARVGKARTRLPAGGRS